MANFCPNCGKTVSGSDRFCVSCGASLGIEPQYTTTYSASQQRSSSSLLDIIAILSIIYGVFAVIGGIALAVLFVFAGSESVDTAGALMFVGGAFGFLYVLSGIFAILAYNYIKKREHAVACLVLLIFSGLLGLNYISIIIGILFGVLVYTARNEFKN